MKHGTSRFLGQAGECYALFRLWESGIVAMLAPPGAPGVDILLYDRQYSLLATVQVRTRSRKEREGWMIQRKQIGKKKRIIFIFLSI
jgi:hypothetical protein